MTSSGADTPDTSRNARGPSLVPLIAPIDGLCARLHLIDRADETLDMQYYEWDADAVGLLVMNRVIAAADRGVRVRLLIDDLKLWKSTRRIKSLCGHPNIDVRVFNPWASRSGAAAIVYEGLRRFGRLDHRMHNKLLLVDGRRAVFGGRNLAEPYFGLSDSYNLIDFDVLADAEPLTRLTEEFERYWRADTAVDASTLRGPAATSVPDVRSGVSEDLAHHAVRLSEVLAREGPFAASLDERVIPLDRDDITVVTDSPKVGSVSPSQVHHALRALVEGATHEVVAITAFFDPTADDIAWYGSVVDSGVRLRLLTNSLATNPGTASNAGLKKVRRSLVDVGFELHELKPHPAAQSHWETPPVSGRYLGIHAKIYVVDRQRTLIGSTNLDPRSKHINTEIGVVLSHTGFAEQMAAGIERLMEPQNAWRVSAGDGSGVTWESQDEVLTRQPARGFGQRLTDGVLRLLPIDRYL